MKAHLGLVEPGSFDVSSILHNLSNIKQNGMHTSLPSFFSSVTRTKVSISRTVAKICPIALGPKAVQDYLFFFIKF